jgi:hypothetical protein
MKPSILRDPGSLPGETNCIALHCLVLTLIGLLAVGVGLVLLPRSEPPPGVMARGAVPSLPAAPENVASAPEPSDSADVPFVYFPAQFPTPRGDAGEQPPTF